MVGVVGSSPIVPTRIPQPDQILMLIRLFVGMSSGVSSSFVLFMQPPLGAFLGTINQRVSLTQCVAMRAHTLLT